MNSQTFKTVFFWSIYWDNNIHILDPPPLFCLLRYLSFSLKMEGGGGNLGTQIDVQIYFRGEK